MFVLYKIREELTLTPQDTHNITKAARNKVLERYLYRYCSWGLCVAVVSINLVNNLLTREEADVLAQLELQLLFLQLKQNEYTEGEVIQMNSKYITVSLFGGVLLGRIHRECMHTNTHFTTAEDWVYVAGEHQAYSWAKGDKVRVRIHKYNIGHGSEAGELLLLRADEEGLGPEKWWI